MADGGVHQKVSRYRLPLSATQLQTLVEQCPSQGVMSELQRFLFHSCLSFFFIFTFRKLFIHLSASLFDAPAQKHVHGTLLFGETTRYMRRGEIRAASQKPILWVTPEFIMEKRSCIVSCYMIIHPVSPLFASLFGASLNVAQLVRSLDVLPWKSRAAHMEMTSLLQWPCKESSWLRLRTS